MGLCRGIVTLASSLTFAEPAVVGNLIVTNVMTTSLSLSWAKPEGNAAFYTIRLAGEGVNVEHNTSETSFVIEDLTPGSQYNISVAAVAVGPSNEGERASTSTFTRKFRSIGRTVRATLSAYKCYIMPSLHRTREAWKHRVDGARDRQPEHPLVIAEREVSELSGQRQRDGFRKCL